MLKIASFLKEKLSDLQFPHCKSEIKLCAPHQRQILFNDHDCLERIGPLISFVIYNLIEILAMPNISGSSA